MSHTTLFSIWRDNIQSNYLEGVHTTYSILHVAEVIFYCPFVFPYLKVIHSLWSLNQDSYSWLKFHLHCSLFMNRFIWFIWFTFISTPSNSTPPSHPIPIFIQSPVSPMMWSTCLSSGISLEGRTSFLISWLDFAGDVVQRETEYYQ